MTDADAARVRAGLCARFDATVARELRAPGTRPLPDGWPPLRLPPALRETMVRVALREGGCPEPLAAWYCDAMPARLIAQLLRDGGPAQALLWAPLDPSRMPRLAAALDGLFAALAGERLDAEAMLGAPTPAELLARRPTPAALYAPTLFGSGLPLLGAYPAELEAIAADLAAGRDPLAALDLRLSGNLVHELCHGLSREVGGEPAPWLLVEAAALHLGATARRRHVFPDEPAEAVPGVSLFVLVGEVIARRCGRRALWSVLAGVPPREALGEAVSTRLAEAAWADWRRRRAPPFVLDAADALDVAKLVEAARAGVPLDGDDPVESAAKIPWRALPWWSEAPDERDRAMVPVGVRALFQVNVLAPNFQTWPDEAPNARLVLDVERCALSAEKRPRGVAGEPARWLFPPPLARLLDERGAREVVVADATRARIDAIAAQLAPPAADVFSSVMEMRPYLRGAAAAAAHDLGLFAALPGDADAIARALGVAAPRLRALLDVLALEGVLRREGGRFVAAAPPAREAVPPGGWGRLAEAIRANRPLSDGDDEERRRFHRHLATAGAAAARAVSTRLAGALGDGVLLDAGGGAGAYTAALLEAAPAARAVLVDRAEVVALARAHLARFGERVAFVEGDLFSAPLPQARVALCANLLHLYGEASCARLIARVAAALAPGGTLAVKDLLIDEDRSGPPAGVLFSLNMALFTDEGAVHSPERIAGWLAAANLVDTRVERLAEVADAVLVTARGPG